MRRRTFIAALGSAAAWPLAASAAQAGQTQRVGVLMGLAETNPELRGFLAAFSEELTRLAAADHVDLQIEARWTNADAKLAQTFAREMVAAKPDVIFASTTPAVAALRAQTASIPIVFAIVSDPVGANFVESLSHPGGNITGFVHTEAKLGGKWLALLKEAGPQAGRLDVQSRDRSWPRGVFPRLVRGHRQVVGN